MCLCTYELRGRCVWRDICQVDGHPDDSDGGCRGITGVGETFSFSFSTSLRFDCYHILFLSLKIDKDRMKNVLILNLSSYLYLQAVGTAEHKSVCIAFVLFCTEGPPYLDRIGWSFLSLLWLLGPCLLRARVYVTLQGQMWFQRNHLPRFLALVSRVWVSLVALFVQLRKPKVELPAAGGH